MLGAQPLPHRALVAALVGALQTAEAEKVAVLAAETAAAVHLSAVGHLALLHVVVFYAQGAGLGGPVAPLDRAPVAAATAPDDHDDLGGLRAALEAVLRSTDDEQQIADVADSAGIIEDLPLWTSRWTALPGFTQASLAFATAPFWAAVCQHTHERVA